MGNFFSIDGPFQKYGTIVADIIIISLLWYILSIPLFTIGAVTTGMFYIFTKQANDRDEYLLKSFFKSIKENFIQATILTIILFLLYTLLFTNIRVISSGTLGLGSTFSMVLLIVQISILLELFFVSLYIFPVLSRFELKIKDIFKTSFYLANKHLFTTIPLVGIFIILYFLIFNVHSMFIIAAPGIYGYLASKLLVVVFKKYRPNMDKYEDAPEKNEPLDDLARRVIDSGTYNRYIPEEKNLEINNLDVNNTEINNIEVNDTEVNNLEEADLKETALKESIPIEKAKEIEEVVETNDLEDNKEDLEKDEFDLKFIMSKEDLKKRK